MWYHIYIQIYRSVTMSKKNTVLGDPPNNVGGCSTNTAQNTFFFVERKPVKFMFQKNYG